MTNCLFHSLSALMLKGYHYTSITSPYKPFQHPPANAKQFALNHIGEASEMDKSHLLKRALIAAGLGALGAIVWHDLSLADTVRVLNMQVPMPAIIGAATGGGTVLADVVHAYILPNTDPKNIKGMAVGVSVSGLGTIGILKLMGADGNSFHWDAFALGGGSYLVSEWIERNYGNILAFP